VSVTAFVLVAAAGSVAEAQRPQAPSPSAEDSTRPRLEAGAALSAAQAPKPQPAPAFRARRRGSMVGYIEDAIIESKLRVRFDAGFHNTTPDRAEFFYAKCGCYRGLSPTNPAFDPEAPGPGPGIVDDLNFQQLYLYGEYAFSSRFSAFGQLPFRWLQPQAVTGSVDERSGVDDIRAGARLGLAASEDQSITGQVRIFFPTGDASRGLGTNHASVEPALLYYQSLNDVVAVESQAGIWLPIDGAAPVPTQADGRFAGDVFFYGVGSSFTLNPPARVQVAPVVELVGWHVLSGNQTATVGDATGLNIVNLKLGARAMFERGSVYAGYGFALTDTDWYDNIFRFEYRYEF
jgi:hypothetical protein